MKSTMFRISSSVLALIGMAIPPMLRADCLPSGPNGYIVPFSLVTLKNFNSGGEFASYSNGTLTISSKSGQYFSEVETLSGADYGQLFSDRYDYEKCEGLSCNEQPFAVDQADRLGVSISRNTVLGRVGPIEVTFTLESWGNNTESFVGSCDATTGSLTGTLNGNTNVLTSFGTPYNPTPK